MSYIDVLYLGLLLVAFLGFAAALFYFWRRWSNRNPPPDWKAKDLGVGKITKAVCASHAFVADRIAERDGGK